MLTGNRNISVLEHNVPAGGVAAKATIVANRGTMVPDSLAILIFSIATLLDILGHPSVAGPGFNSIESKIWIVQADRSLRSGHSFDGYEPNQRHKEYAQEPRGFVLKLDSFHHFRELL